MSTGDWARVIDELHAMGVGMVQFIGGEPMLHHDLPVLIEHAVGRGLRVEVYSNLVHVPATVWPTLALPGVSLATSYYSDDATEHDAVTGRRSHARTRATIAEAVRRGIPVRAGVVAMTRGQRVVEAADDLIELGVTEVRTDRLRGVGRGGRPVGLDAPTSKVAAPGVLAVEAPISGVVTTNRIAELCGHCVRGVIAISPTGEVWPCVFSRWLPVGNVLDQDLAAILSCPEAVRVRTELEAEFAKRGGTHPCVPNMCDPDCGPSCSPACVPAGNCRPVGSCAPDYG
jgi:MoaA/NifB/PqqE/SkfB family radical SAM enzyme